MVQSMADKDLLDRDGTARPLFKTASKQYALTYFKDNEQLVVDKAVVGTEFGRYRAKRR